MNWEPHYFRSGWLVLSGLYIINRYIATEDAVELTYSFN